MSKPSAPQAPDPTQTAAAQTQSNIQTATANAGLNRINQYTPYGNLEYNINGTNPDGTPQYSQTASFSPGEQQLFNQGLEGQQKLGQIGLNSLQNVGNTYSQGFNPGNFGAQQKQAQDAAYNAQTQYLDPQFAKSQDTLNTQLANEGLQTGDKGYNDAQQLFGLGKQQAYQGAQNQAITAGNQEQQQLFGQALTQYNEPLNLYSALASGSQVSQPNFNPVPGVNQQGTDIAGITNQAYQNQLAGYNAQQQGINNLFGLGGSLGAAAILAP
jgi:hypothetical protein